MLIIPFLAICDTPDSKLIKYKVLYLTLFSICLWTNAKNNLKIQFLRKFWELTKLFKLIPTQKFRTFELTFHKLQEKDSQSKDLGQSLKNYRLPSKYAITLKNLKS